MSAMAEIEWPCEAGLKESATLNSEASPLVSMIPRRSFQYQLSYQLAAQNFAHCAPIGKPLALSIHASEHLGCHCLPLVDLVEGGHVGVRDGQDQVRVMGRACLRRVNGIGDDQAGLLVGLHQLLVCRSQPLHVLVELARLHLDV